MEKTSKILKVTLLMWALLVASVYMAPSIPTRASEIVEFDAASGQSNTYVSRPTNYSFSPPWPGVRAGIPTDAYDGDFGTSSDWAYTLDEFLGYGDSDGYFEFTAYSPTAGTPRGSIITQVNLSCYYYGDGTFGDATLNITFVVGSSDAKVLQSAFQPSYAFYNETWVDQVDFTEPNDGIWTWEDLSNLRFRFGRTDPDGADFGGQMYIYEVWATISYETPQTHVNPRSQASQPLTVTVNATNVEELYGFEFKLYYNARVLTATSVTLGSFLNETAGAGNTYGSIECVRINDTLGLVWVTQTIKGDIRGGRLNLTNGDWGILATINFVKDADGNSNFDLESKLVGFNYVPVAFSYGEAVKKTYFIEHTVTMPIHEVKVTDVVAIPMGVNQGGIIEVNVTVVNEGDYNETFDVTIWSGDIVDQLKDVVDSQTVTNLGIGITQNVSLTWNTTGHGRNYTLTAVADTLGPPLESNTTNNMYTCSEFIWIGPDIEVYRVECDPWYEWDVLHGSRIFAGDAVDVNVTVRNRGPESEPSFDVNLYATQGWIALGDARQSDNRWASSSADGSTSKWLIYEFNITDPVQWTGVDMVEVGMERWVDTGTDNITIAVTNDNGTSWSAITYTDVVSETTDTLVWTDVTSAFAWTPTMITGVGVELKYENVSTPGIIRVDYLPIRVTPTALSPVEKAPTLWQITSELDDAYYLLGTKSVTNLASLASEVVSFTWDTTGYSNSSYVMKANTSDILLEIVRDNNAYETSTAYNIYVGPDIAVTNVEHNATIVDGKAVVDAGDTVSINATVENLGSENATFNVYAWAGTTPVGTQLVTDMMKNTTQTLGFTWVPAVNGIYSVMANTTVLLGEALTIDNTFVHGVVYVGPDIAVTKVEPDETIVDAGDPVVVEVTVKNQGVSPVSFNVYAWANDIPLGTKSVTDLANNTAQVLTFPTWNPASNGTYTIMANATILTGESDTADNTKVDGVVYVGPDIAVTSVKPDKTHVYEGDPVIVKVTVKNQGDSPVSFSVDAWANTTLLGTESVTDLASKTEEELTFPTWNPASNGTYTIMANATILTGESDTADNSLWYYPGTLPIRNVTVYVGPDVVVSGITYVSKTEIYQGETVTVRAKVMNEGAYTETFDVKLYANLTLVDTWTAEDLRSGRVRIHTFSWSSNATFLRGDYVVKAEATPLAGETDIDDNTAEVTVRVRLLGDTDDNGVVDARDLYTLSRAFDSQEAYRSTPRSSNWNAEADLNGDNFLTTDELITLINNYGETG